MSLFPLAAFDVIDDAVADGALSLWGHYLGPCDRPFGRQSFGLYVADQLIGVAVSASTVSSTCAGRPRNELVELARLVTMPGQPWATRVTLRLWRQLAPKCWHYWPATALVSYSNETRHRGDIYRFDGWTRVGVQRGSTGGGTWTHPQPREDKALWIFPIH